MTKSATNDKFERFIISGEELGFAHIHALGRYRYKAAQRELSPHKHLGKMEFCFLVKGKQVYEVNGREYHLRGGDFFVTFPDEVHSTAGKPEGKGSVYWLTLQIPKRGKPFLALPPPEARPLLNALLNLPLRHFRETGETEKILESLLAAGCSPADPLRRTRIANLLTRFFLTVIESAERATPSSSSRPVARALAFITDNLTEPLAVADLARAACLSESRFKTVFKKETGIPPAEFVLRAKITRAQTLLCAASAVSVTNIAFALGFSSSQHFATVFKRFTHLSPSAWRARENNVL